GLGALGVGASCLEFLPQLSILFYSIDSPLFSRASANHSHGWLLMPLTSILFRVVSGGLILDSTMLVEQLCCPLIRPLLVSGPARSISRRMEGDTQCVRPRFIRRRVRRPGSSTRTAHATGKNSPKRRANTAAQPRILFTPMSTGISVITAPGAFRFARRAMAA